MQVNVLPIRDWAELDPKAKLICWILQVVEWVHQPWQVDLEIIGMKASLRTTSWMVVGSKRKADYKSFLLTF